MELMKAIQVSAPGGSFELVERPLPAARNGEVRIKVHACGICHTDLAVKEGGPFPVQYPRVPGHEVAGVIDQLGPEVVDWQVGQRVGVGWHGGSCGACWSCRQGDVACCENLINTGVSSDGGYAEYMVARTDALVRIPEQLSFVAAAPLLCAGLASFDALRNCGARPGDVVAILGIGGLGHLGIQYGRKMGFKTVALGLGPDLAAEACRLGAHAYIDTAGSDFDVELQKMGGAGAILVTAADKAAIARSISGLRAKGRMMLLAGPREPLEIVAGQLIGAKRAIQGWVVGGPRDNEEMLDFTVLTGVKAMIETFPLEQVSLAFAKMLASKVRFKAVLTMT